MGGKKGRREKSKLLIDNVIIGDWRHVSPCLVGDTITDKMKLFQNPKSGSTWNLKLL